MPHDEVAKEPQALTTLAQDHGESFSVSEIAHTVDLTPSAVSRVMRALEDAAFVREAKPGAGGRRRNVRLERPRALLDAWLPLWQRRRVHRRRWDIGARDRLAGRGSGDPEPTP